MSEQLSTKVNLSVFKNKDIFDETIFMATKIAGSTVIPTEYRNNPANIVVAFEYANRLKQSPLAIMQNLNVIHGKPSLSATMLIALINTSGLYKHSLRFAFEGEEHNRSCCAYTHCATTNDRLVGTTINMKMVNAEGWATKTGSKWKTMPDQMLMYRAASFFARIHCPELIMGMHTEDEIVDSVAPPAAPTSNVLEVLQPQETPLASAERVEKALSLCGLELVTIEEYLGKTREDFTNADMNKLASLYQLSRKQGVTCAEIIEAEKNAYTDVEVVETPAE